MISRRSGRPSRSRALTGKPARPTCPRCRNWSESIRLGHVKPRLTGKEPVLSADFTGSGGTAAAYTYFDWSDPAKNYVTPVRNQSSCGSCWAFAAAGALESYTLIKNNLVGQDINLSEQVLVSCSGAGSCGGGSIGSASNYIRDKGLPVEGCFPYTATNNLCSSACYTYQTDSYRIQSWAYVATTSVSVEAIKNALVTYGPLVTTMDVYADFFNYRTGIYSYVSGAYQGGHAILIVGYDDAAQCFKAKNSWGTGWARRDTSGSPTRRWETPSTSASSPLPTTAPHRSHHRLRRLRRRRPARSPSRPRRRPLPTREAREASP